MAVRKEKVLKQFTDAVAPHLDPGETLVVGTFVLSGPSPFLMAGLFGFIGFVVANVRYYFIWLTDRRVIFLRASFFTAKPNGMAWSDLRSASSVTSVKPASTWSSLRYHRPAGGKPLRLNFARPFRAEFSQIADALGRTPPT